MAKSTVRTNLPAVQLDAASSDYLEFRLKVVGSRANFSQADDNANRVVTHMNFGLVDEVIWRLQSAPSGAGDATVSGRDATGQMLGTYQRTEPLGTVVAYTLRLGFVTAVDYTLQVRRFSSSNMELELITDVDFQMEDPTDRESETLFVGFGAAK
jgi:hypothetical protein